VGALALLLTLRYMPDAPRLPQRGLDLAGQLAGILLMTLVTFACIEGGAWGWSSPPIVGAFTLSIAVLAVFLAIEKYSPQPMLPLPLFRAATFSTASTVGLFLNFGFYGQLFLISLYFQHVREYTPQLTGLALLPETSLVLLASPLSGRIAGRYGPRRPMFIGLLVGSLGFAALLLAGSTTSYLALIPMLAAVGFGTSFTMPAMTVAVMEATPQTHAGIASAVLNASRQVGSVLGVAILGALVSQHQSFLLGMHVALGLAAGAFLLASVLTAVNIRVQPAVRRVEQETSIRTAMGD
ncbi:MAG: MFS transporter, partial [Chloroflexi bacterium]|nr:MFS transporter [Chloroflexota bacterium]